MKVALVGATGKIGGSISQELLRRGHAVTAISRHPEATPAAAGVSPAAGDILDPEALASVLAGHDVIASSARFLPDSSSKLIDAVEKSRVVRFLVVGGAGTLDDGNGRMLVEVREPPPERRALVMEAVALLTQLRANTNLDWTYVTPPTQIGPGERLGRYRSHESQPVRDQDGKNFISYGDFAIAFVDEIETGEHIRSRFTVGY